MGGAIVLLLLIVVVAIILPFVALVQSAEAKRRVEALEIEVRRLRDLRAPEPLKAEPELRAAKVSAPPLVPPSALPSPTPHVAPEAVTPEAIAPPVERPARPPQPPRLHPAPPVNLEQFMGAKLFAWVGGLALFLGILFFVKLSIERGWISPAMRTAIGFAIGAGLLAAGNLVHQRKQYWTLAQTLSATGVLILYGVTFAAHSLYAIPPLDTPVGAFLMMVAITALAFLLALRMNAQVVAVLGILGGFLTPVLCSTGRDQPLALFGYIALLDIGVLALMWNRPWSYLSALAAFGTVLMQFGWFEKFCTEAVYGEGMASWVPISIFLGFALLFLGGAFAKRKLEGDDRFAVGSTIALCLSGMLASFALLGFEGIAERPLLLYTLVLGLNGVSMVLAWRDDRAMLGYGAVSVLAMLHLSTWTFDRLSIALLPQALSIYLVWGLGNTLFILAKDRLATASIDVTASRVVVMALQPFLLLIFAADRLNLADPSPVFLVGMVLVLFMFGAERMCHRQALAPGALVGSLALLAAWHFDNFDTSFATVPLAWYLGFYGVFTVYPWIARRAVLPQTVPWATSLTAGIGIFGLIYKLMLVTWPNDFMGLLPAAFALAPLVMLHYVNRYHTLANPARLNQLAWAGGVTLLFITLVMPIQFEKQWITLGWALEGAALCWWFRRVPHPGVRGLGFILLVVSFGRLALNPAVLHYQLRGDVPILNWQLYAYSLAAGAMFFAAQALRPPRDRWQELNLRGLLFGMGGVLLFLLLNIEIADAFTPTGSRSIVFEFQGNLARDMTYTIAWALFALGLLVLGLWKKLPPTRYAGIGLLGTVMLKLFLQDLANIDSGYRIGALVAVALIALAASFLYQRFLREE